MGNVCNRRLFSFPSKVKMAEEQGFYDVIFALLFLSFSIGKVVDHSSVSYLSHRFSTNQKACSVLIIVYLYMVSRR